MPFFGKAAFPHKFVQYATFLDEPRGRRRYSGDKESCAGKGARRVPGGKPALRAARCTGRRGREKKGDRDEDQCGDRRGGSSHAHAVGRRLKLMMAVGGEASSAAHAPRVRCGSLHFRDCRGGAGGRFLERYPPRGSPANAAARHGGQARAAGIPLRTAFALRQGGFYRGARRCRGRL